MDENMTNSNVAEEQQVEEQEVKTYTQEEVLELLQRESDKRVSQALKTQQKKYEKQLSLSKLDGEERAKAEKDAEIAELREQLAQFQIERNRSELKSVLSSRGLSAEFADIIAINDDIEASQANIDSLKQALEYVVTDGLGQPAKSNKVEVAGKTGTVQLEDGSYIVEFCGYFPANAPQYSIIVSIHKEGLPASGGLMAGDVFRQIVDYMNE